MSRTRINPERATKRTVRGTTGEVVVPANSYTDATITYTGFTTIPIVMLTMRSNSTAPTMGNISCSVFGRSATSATVRVYNASTTARQPTIDWVAIGY